MLPDARSLCARSRFIALHLLTVSLSGCEAVGIRVEIDALFESVNPPETEGLLDSFRVGQARFSRGNFAEANPQFGAFGVTDAQPVTKRGRRLEESDFHPWQQNRVPFWNVHYSNWLWTLELGALAWTQLE